MKRIKIDYEDMIRMDNLLAADIVVRQGKKYTRDMRKWDANWQTNFQLLYDDLINETYTPLPCRESVRMTDGGKVRNIKEAMHRDKIVAEMIVQALGLKSYERYCDDVVIFDKDKKVLHTALRDIREYLTTKRKLDIKPNWQVFPVDSRGVDFLGSVFYTYKIDLRTRTKHRHRAKLSRLNKRPSDPLYEDRYMASLNGILKHRDTDNLIKIWRIKYERVFKRHEQRAAVRAAFNEHKRRVKALEAELQYYGDIADGIRGQ